MTRVVRDRYEVIGRAGRSTVVGLDRLHERRVAIQVVACRSDAARARVLGRAGLLLGARAHPGIAVPREDFFEDGRYHLVTDWTEGRPIDALTTPDEVYACLDQLADALEHLHAHEPPIVHLDVRARNVLVGADGRCLLVGFGLRHVRSARPDVDATDFADVAASLVARDRASGDRPREILTRLRGTRTRGNLPSEPTPFVGRTTELGEIAALLERERLISLIGTGGIGKTRLARAAAAAAAARFPDGTWLVEASGVREPWIAPDVVASALGLPETDEPATDALARFCSSRRLLLVLDGCERLRAAWASLAERLLRAAPGLRILATSREALSVSGEHRLAVGPLPFSSEPGAEPDAVRLLRDRLRTTGVEADDATLSRICARLEGIPLAIELAASRAAALGAAAVAAGLEDRPALEAGALRAAIEWSHDLLAPAERVLFRRLATFAGGCTIEATEAVCTGPRLEPDAVLDGLAALVDRSLIAAEERRGTVRYRMLDTLAEFAGEQLVAAGEDRDVRHAHLGWAVSLAESSSADWWGPREPVALERLEAEHDNLRSALAFAADADPDAMVHLTSALGPYWATAGHLREGRERVAAALRLAPPGERRARLLVAAAGLAHAQGDHASAARLCTEALAFADEPLRSEALRALGQAAGARGDYRSGERDVAAALAVSSDLDDRGGIAACLQSLGRMAAGAGDYERADVHYAEALGLYREMGSVRGQAGVLYTLALMAHARGDGDRSIELAEQSLALRRALRDRQGTASSLAGLAAAWAAQGEGERARLVADEAISLARELGDVRSEAAALQALADLALDAGEAGRAAGLVSASIRLRRATGDRIGLIESLGAASRIAALEGDDALAARMLAAAESARAEVGAHVPAGRRRAHDRLVADLRSGAGDEWERGSRLSLDAAVEEALRLVDAWGARGHECG